MNSLWSGHCTGLSTQMIKLSSVLGGFCFVNEILLTKIFMIFCIEVYWKKNLTRGLENPPWKLTCCVYFCFVVVGWYLSKKNVKDGDNTCTAFVSW